MLLNSRNPLLIGGIRVTACLLALFFIVGEAHEFIPGLHVKDDATGRALCPFCKLVLTPALLLSALVLLLIFVRIFRSDFFEERVLSAALLPPWRGRAPPRIPA